MSTGALQLISCTVEQPMNSHGAMTLAEEHGNRTFQVVDYGSPRIQASLFRCRHGESIRVQLKRVDSRGEAWRVTDLNTDAEESQPRESLSRD